VGRRRLRGTLNPTLCPCSPSFEHLKPCEGYKRHGDLLRAGLHEQELEEAACGGELGASNAAKARRRAWRGR
jgi:hypothetical protein